MFDNLLFVIKAKPQQQGNDEIDSVFWRVSENFCFVGWSVSVFLICFQIYRASRNENNCFAFLFFLLKEII